MAEIMFSFDVCLSVCNGPANSSKMIEATDFKFDKYVPKDRLGMTLKQTFSKRERGKGHVPPKFWRTNANSSKMVKATDFKFGRHGTRNSNDITTEKFSERGQGPDHVTHRFLAISANVQKRLKLLK